MSRCVLALLGSRLRTVIHLDADATVLCASRAFASDRICRTMIGLLRRGVGGVYVQSNSASPGRVA